MSKSTLLLLSQMASYIKINNMTTDVKRSQFT